MKLTDEKDGLITEISSLQVKLHDLKIANEKESKKQFEIKRLKDETNTLNLKLTNSKKSLDNKIRENQKYKETMKEKDAHATKRVEEKVGGETK